MADAPVVHIGENSPEEVALKLFRLIAVNEGKPSPTMMAAKGETFDREYVLKTYRSCIAAVRGINE